mgnify:CR=1 FL=1
MGFTWLTGKGEYSDDLKEIVSQLELARVEARDARGTDNAESTAQRFLRLRRRALQLGLPPTSDVLKPLGDKGM